MSPHLTLFGYSASPYAQKIHLLLTAAGIPYTLLNQPPVLPRPDLEAVGITYRRIPLLAVDRDVYADSSAIIDVILHQLGGKDKITTSKADKAYEVWGNDTFKAIMPLLPEQALTPGFVKDRETIFPLLAKPQLLKAMLPTALADLKSRLAHVEDVLLADSPFVGGQKLSVADIHVIWALRWVLQDLGAAKRFSGLDKQAYPKVWQLIASLPKPNGEKVDKETAISAIRDAELFSKNVSVAKDDPLKIAQGADVTVESADTKPGAHPQAGKLAGTSAHEIMLALESGVQLHFPRSGYLVRESGGAKL
ncbi:hypothetical protein Q7P37_002312 [Cladosporium fusiforme]